MWQVDWLIGFEICACGRHEGQTPTGRDLGVVVLALWLPTFASVWRTSLRTPTLQLTMFVGSSRRKSSTGKTHPQSPDMWVIVSVLGVSTKPSTCLVKPRFLPTQPTSHFLSPARQFGGFFKNLGSFKEAFDHMVTQSLSSPCAMSCRFAPDRVLDESAFEFDVTVAHLLCRKTVARARFLPNRPSHLNSKV